MKKKTKAKAKPDLPVYADPTRDLSTSNDPKLRYNKDAEALNRAYKDWCNLELSVDEVCKRHGFSKTRLESHCVRNDLPNPRSGSSGRRAGYHRLNRESRS